jgi:hypothetical protein
MRNAVWLSGLFLAVLGCSGNDLPAFHPKAAPGWTPLSGLSADQVQALCGEQNAYVTMLATSPEGRDVLCRELGHGAALKVWVDAMSTDPPATVTDGDVQRACASAYASCIARPPLVGGGASCDRAAIVILTDCAGTVDEYAACETALVTPRFALPEACSALTVGALTPPPASDAGPPVPPPACQTFWAMCAALEGTVLGAGI